MTPLRTAIEGPVCAGKTTLANGLRDYAGHANTVVVPDYADFVGGDNMPTANPVDLEEERTALAQLLEIEGRRFRSLPAFSGEQATLRLIDRSVLTLLGHCAGLDAANSTNGSFLELGQSIVRDSSLVVLPQLLIYLDADLDTQIARNDGKFDPKSIFLDARLNEGFRNYFASLAGEGDRTWALWVDARLPASEILEQAINFLAANDECEGADRCEILM